MLIFKWIFFLPLHMYRLWNCGVCVMYISVSIKLSLLESQMRRTCRIFWYLKKKLSFTYLLDKLASRKQGKFIPKKVEIVYIVKL